MTLFYNFQRAFQAGTGSAPHEKRHIALSQGLGHQFACVTAGTVNQYFACLRHLGFLLLLWFDQRAC
ncbi:hypothetical protein D3C80_1988890 [compost metagenome]